MIVLNHLENQSLQPLPLILTFSTAWQWVHHLLHVSISAIILQLTGTQRNKQTVETATYGSEFVAAKTATEQIMDIRYTLRYLGVPIRSKSYMFGDNRSVVTSATLPHSTLSKRHNILAFHQVREAIAARIIDFHWIKSEYNLCDMLSKHWEHNKIFPIIQKILITCGPITLIPKSATEETFKPPEQKGYSQHTKDHNHPPFTLLYILH